MERETSKGDRGSEKSAIPGGHDEKLNAPFQRPMPLTAAEREEVCMGLKIQLLNIHGIS